MRVSRATVGLPLLVSGLLACGSGNDPDGGSTPPLVGLDTTSGRIAIAESDTFLLRAPATGSMVIYVQALDSNIIEVAAEGFEVLSHPATSASYVNHPPLEANRTTRFPVLADSVYRLIVRPPAGTLARYRAGRYRFLPAMVDPRPEHTPEHSPLGIDYTIEDLGSPHDVDEWILGAPIADTMGVALKVTVGPGGDVPVLASLHTNTAFNDFQFTIPPGGGTVQSELQYSSAVYQWYAQIRADDPAPLQTHAPVLPLVHVQTIVADFRPEHGSARLTLGDTLEEQIDSVGDVDTWRMPKSAGPNAAYVGGLALVSGAPGDTLRLSISDDIGTAPPNLLVTVGDTVLLEHLTAPVQPVYNFVTARVAASHLASADSRPTYRFVLLPAAGPSKRVRTF